MTIKFVGWNLCCSSLRTPSNKNRNLSSRLFWACSRVVRFHRRRQGSNGLRFEKSNRISGYNASSRSSWDLSAVWEIWNAVKKKLSRNCESTGVIPMTSGATTHDILIQQGYKLIDDKWEKNARRTYIHNDDASGTQISTLKRTLGRAGWVRDRNALWLFNHPLTDEILELEPGGENTSGHFLHHMKATGG
jgi:hypothetical protein